MNFEIRSGRYSPEMDLYGALFYKLGMSGAPLNKFRDLKMRFQSSWT
jgi:hypothetical protein